MILEDKGSWFHEENVIIFCIISVKRESSRVKRGTNRHLSLSEMKQVTWRRSLWTNKVNKRCRTERKKKCLQSGINRKRKKKTFSFHIFHIYWGRLACFSLNHLVWRAFLSQLEDHETFWKAKSRLVVKLQNKAAFTSTTEKAWNKWSDTAL